MRYHSQLWNLLALALAVIAFPAAAQQNLLTNGSFDTNLSGWTTWANFGAWEWQSDDWASSPSSGSAKANGTDMILSQCLAGPVLEKYEYSGKYRFDSGSRVLVMVMYAYAQPGCVGAELARSSDFNGRTSGAWHNFGSPSPPPPLVVPPGTQSVGVEIRIVGGFFATSLDELIVTGGTLPNSPDVSIRGPGNAKVGELQYFTATGTDCTGSLSRGWNWTVNGGRIVGYSDTATIAVVFDAEGTHSLTASHSGCGSATGSHSVLAGLTGARISVWPGASYLYQPAGTPLGRTAYWISNYGDRASTISLEADGDFFTQSPAGVTIAPGGNAEITVTGKNVSPGLHRHRSFFSGDGLTQFLAENGQLIQLLVFASEPTDGEAEPDRNRVDVTGEASSVTFRNTGSLALEAQVIATEPWIVPEEDRLTIPAGGSMPVGFSIDPSLRPDADDPFGSVTGEIGLQYATTAAAAKSSGITPSQTGGSVSTTLVTVIHTVAPPASAGEIPPLAPGEVALFVPGVGHVAGSVGTFISDLSMVNLTRRETLGSLKLYFNPLPGSPGTGSQSATIASLKPNQPIALADLVGTVFKQGAQLGSLQIRSSAIDSINVAATVFNASNPAGTFGTTIPVVRSDRGAGSGEKSWIAGLKSDATHHTNLFIQEMTGSAVTVRTDFLGSAGNTVGSRTDTVPAFALIQFGNVVPEGAVSAVLTNTGASGRFFAYATPVDRASGDTWAVSDWPRQFGYSRNEPAVIPVAGAVRGANNTFFRTDLAIMNTGSGPASGTLRYLDRTGPVIDRQISLAPAETKVFDNVTSTLFGLTGETVGHMTWTPGSGEVVITSRNFTTVEGDAATFGSGVPTLARSASLVPGAMVRLGGIEDSALQTVLQGRPASFRTNFGIVETSGSAAKVRVTVRYVVNSGRVSERAGAWTEIDLPANGFLLASSLVRSVIGEQRDQFIGDLRNVEVDFELAGGEGRVLVFTTSVDNGTGDSIFRSE